MYSLIFLDTYEFSEFFYNLEIDIFEIFWRCSYETVLSITQILFETNVKSSYKNISRIRHFGSDETRK